jgi:hypothetical protein
VIDDRPPALEPAPTATSPERRGTYLGQRRITPVVISSVLVGIALLGSLAYIVYVVLKVEDEQIQLLGYGFAVLGASFAAIALGCVYEIWRAARRARTGRALVLSIIGGLAGLAAIACFSFTAIATMLGAS